MSEPVFGTFVILDESPSMLHMVDYATCKSTKDRMDGDHKPYLCDDTITMKTMCGEVFTQENIQELCGDVVGTDGLCFRLCLTCMGRGPIPTYHQYGS